MAATAGLCSDRVILDQWHPIGVADETEPGAAHHATLLGTTVGFSTTADGTPIAWRSDPTKPIDEPVDTAAVTDPLPTLSRYGYLWASLGSPPDRLFEIPEYAEPDRRNLHAATIGVHCSAPRAIENFLDMSHFPFVHTDILGVEPHTEVVEYDVRIDDTTNEIWATECYFWQPLAAATSSTGARTNRSSRTNIPSASHSTLERRPLSGPTKWPSSIAAGSPSSASTTASFGRPR